MRSLSASELIEAWDGPEAETSHARLERVLGVVLDAAELRRDTLGRRNQRLIALRRSLCGPRPVEVAARCQCGIDNEATVPVDAIEAAPVPAPDQRTAVAIGGRTVSARPPVMEDLMAIAGFRDLGQAAAALLARCVDAANDDDLAEPGPLVAALAERFEAMDPAADVRLSIRCVGCGTPLSVVVDLAASVSRDIAHQVAALMAEIDCLARAYGWSEAAILALPPGRRRRYVAMVQGETLGGIG